MAIFIMIFGQKCMKNGGGGSNSKIFCAFLLNSVLGGNKLAKPRRWEAGGKLQVKQVCAQLTNSLTLFR